MLGIIGQASRKTACGTRGAAVNGAEARRALVRGNDSLSRGSEHIRERPEGIQRKREWKQLSTLDQHAIELDPNFAMAYYDVGDGYYSLNQLGRASQYYTKAFELRQHANDRSKLLITGNYYSTVTGEHDKAARTFHEMIETYPRSATAYFSLGEEYAALGQYETAAEMTAKSQELGPGEVPAYSNLTGYQLALGSLRRGPRNDWAKAKEHNMDGYMFRVPLYTLSFSTAMTSRGWQNSSAGSLSQRGFEAPKRFRSRPILKLTAARLNLASRSDETRGGLTRPLLPTAKRKCRGSGGRMPPCAKRHLETRCKHCKMRPRD